MQRVLFLCTGNTCRSPLAEVFARQLNSAAGLHFESAGLQANGRQPASEGSLRVASDAGLSLEGFLSRPVSADLLDDSVWVIGMTRSHAAIFRSRYGGYYKGKVGVLGAPGIDFTQLTNSPVCEEVDDPYGQSIASYTAAGEQILRLTEQWTETFASSQS